MMFAASVAPSAAPAATPTRTPEAGEIARRPLYFAALMVAAGHADGSVGGAANVLDLSSVMHFGGKLTAMATWTIDAVYGVDDNLVLISDKGEVAVYRGTDPTSASTWSNHPAR